VKNAFCLAREADAFLGQHIGDLENLETLEHYEAMIAWYERLFRVTPEVVGYDLHPEYLATKYALRLPQAEKVAIQHHHAHVAACLVEHGREQPVIGVCMDGLGYGHDGRLWGGEVLVADLTGYRRVAHLEELPLAGGARAIKQPWRTAAGWSYALLGEEGFTRAVRLLQKAGNTGGGAPSDDEVAALRGQIDASVNALPTTSCGRLFDAVSALAGVRLAVTYEGQAAIELEALADRAPGAAPPYPFTLDGDAGAAATGTLLGAAEWVAAQTNGRAEDADPPAALRLGALFGGVLDDLEAGAPAAVVGARLHVTIAAAVVQFCRRVRSATDLDAVALVGGVFQNRLLSELCESALLAEGFTVLTADLVPGNDGGVALGQAAVAGYTALKQRSGL
jgi:hydrogenase maturation protein HypF